MQQLEIGYFSRTHGVKGQLVLRSEHDLDLDALKAVFVDVRGARAPYFVSGVMESNNGIVLTLEEISTVEQARTLLNKPVFADASVVQEEEEEDLVGFELHDHKLGRLGAIESIVGNGAQDVFVLTYKMKEIMLPAVEEFISLIDPEKKIIHYKAPPGLIDLYLSGDEFVGDN